MFGSTTTTVTRTQLVKAIEAVRRQGQFQYPIEVKDTQGRVVAVMHKSGKVEFK